MSESCPIWFTKPLRQCLQPVVAEWEYGRGGATIRLCALHDKQVRDHVKECRTMRYEPWEMRGDCPNYLKRKPISR